MSGPKKHPLEIYRSSGGQLGDPAVRAKSSGGGDAPVASEAPDAPKPRAARPVEEFELRLSLNGALILVFVWVVLMAASHLYGVHRGRSAALGEQDAEARALGERIEEGAPQGESSTGAATADAPYGVLLVTYRFDDPQKANEKIGEVREVLRTTYGISQFVAFATSSGLHEVFVGLADDKDDPALIALEAKLHQIADYPKGDKRPFADARIKRMPRDPRTARPIDEH